MDKDFTLHPEALELKQLGFDEPCFGIHYYKESYPMLNPQSGETELVFEFGQYIKQTEVATLAPTYSQAFRWFRDKHGLDSSILPTGSTPYQFRLYHKSQDTIKAQIYDDYMGKEYKTYEEAELACLKKLIEIVKEVNK
jgi:hypothetical protein